MNANYNHTVGTTNGQRESTQDSSQENISVRVAESVTPLLSYDLSLRGARLDFRTIDAAGAGFASRRTSVEPALDVSLHNSLYDIIGGIRRREDRSEGPEPSTVTRITDATYGRAGMSPRDLPSLTLQYDRQQEHGVSAIRTDDRTTERASAQSNYRFTGGRGEASYNLGVFRDRLLTPNDPVVMTRQDSLSGQTRLVAKQPLGGQTGALTATYQANYGTVKQEQLAGQPGRASLKRQVLAGLAGLGTETQPGVEVLQGRSELIDGNYYAATSLTLGAAGQKYRNLGVQTLSPERAVDALRVYVNRDVRADVNLALPGNWKVYWSNTNVPGAVWTEAALQRVTVGVYDEVNGVAYYELALAAPRNAAYFKAVNLAVVDAPGAAEAAVTELEAYGTDELAGATETRDSFFAQELALDAQARLAESAQLSLTYSVKRTDNNPRSFDAALTGLAGNLYSKRGDDATGKQAATTIRTVSTGGAWRTSEALTPGFRFSRTEQFDNRRVTDLVSNNSTLSLLYAPLPTLDATLSLTRTDSSSFGEKQTLQDMALLSVGTRIYRGLNLITDTGASSSHGYGANPSSHARFLRGVVDATVTRSFFATMRYGVAWTTSAGKLSVTRDGSAVFTYRPGALINISAPLRAVETDGVRTTSKGVSVDWLPFPAVRLSASGLRTDSEQDATVVDALTGTVAWVVAKSVNAGFAYQYTTRQMATDRTATTLYGANITGKF